MSLFFGVAGRAKPQFTGLAVQTSTSSVPVTILMGLNRIAPNIIFQDDFEAHKQKQKAGKGGGKGVTQYTYSATYQLALCYGEIGDVPRAWKDQSTITSYAELGFSLFTGAANQAPWGYLVTNHPDKALGYPHIAHLDAANYDLGGSNALGQHSFEVEGPLYNTQVGGNGDADPAQCVDNLINNPIYGAVGGAANAVNAIPLLNLLSTGAATSTGDDAFQTYCRAIGFGLSPALISQEPARTIIQRWADLCNTAMVWTGSAVKMVPRGTEEITANGVHYLPDLTVRYSLTDRDFVQVDGQDPITFERIDPADAYNIVTLNIRNRQNEYNVVPAVWVDQGLVDQYGPRPKDVQEASEVCELEMGGLMAALVGQRTAYVRNTYNFKLPPSYCLLEPMDILECYDPRWGFFYVQISDIDEDDNDQLSITAEEFGGPGGGGSGMPFGNISNPGPVNDTVVENNPINSNVSPGPVNPPIFMQPPPSLTNYEPQIWAAISGGNGTVDNPNWGGAQVWISTDGGFSYNMVGEVDAPARMGVLTDDLPPFVGTNPDTTNPLSVSSAMSNAEFSDATADDAAGGVTLTYIEAEGANVEEFLSYTTATLTGADAYDLEDLYRGLNGSEPGAHATGARFARLDDGLIFKYNFPIELIGQTIYVKLVSFNIFGGGLEDISSVTPYSFTISNDYVYGISLQDLNNVDTSTLADGDVLIWDATLQTWVPGTAGGGASVTVSTTPPASPTQGMFWWKSDAGRLKIYYEDVDGGQWVDAFPLGFPGNGGGGATGIVFDPPLAASFSFASGDATNLTLTDDPDVGLLIDAGAPASGQQIRAAYRTLTDKTQDWDMIVDLQTIKSSANWSGWGLVAFDSTSSNKAYILGSQSDFPLAGVMKFTNLTTHSSTPASVVGAVGDVCRFYRIRKSGSTIYFEVAPSVKGPWSLVYSESDTAWLTNRADSVGIYGYYDRGSGIRNGAVCGYFSLTGPGV